MIDIHSHVIPFVDDGSGSLENSIKMLKTAEENGVTDLVCTPHYRRSLFETPKETLIENFELLKKRNETSVRLYLGQEIAFNKNVYSMLEKDELLTMNGTKYILLEFHYVDYVDISGVVFECKLRGFKPIIAHIERYEYLSDDDIEEIFYSGALIQVNASSLNFGSHYRGKVKRLIKKGLVHMVSSDVHVGRTYDMKKAFSFVAKKYGADKATALFGGNAAAIIKIKS